jgi:cAMP-dependent protein kinase regulator
MADDKALRKARTRLDKALEANKNEEAIKALAELIKFEPSNARWPHKRGDLLRKLGRNPEAVDCYTAAVTIYADQGFIARAVAMAKTVLNLDPSRIDILEQVDPAAAAQLRARPRSPVAAPAPQRHPMLLDDEPALTVGSGAKKHPQAAHPQAAAGSAPKRHPMVAGSDPSPPTAAKRHPMVADSVAQSPPTAAKRHPMVVDSVAPPPAAAKRHPMVVDSAAPPPTAAKRHPMVVDSVAPPPSAAKQQTLGADAALHKPAAQRAQPAVRPAATVRPVAISGRPVTLDKLSLPAASAASIRPAPTSDRAAARDAAEIYTQALDGIEELQVDPRSPANETRFSNAPPRASVEVDLSDVEIAPRERLSAVESLQPEPPAAAKLAKLPLFPLFAEAPKEALAHMIEGSELIELEHGDYVMRKGDPGDALYGIVEGSVDVVVPGQQFRVTLAEGDVFGEACLLEDEQCHADAIVEGKLVALRVPRDTLVLLLQYHPPLAEVLLELLTRRLLGNLLQAAPLFAEFDGPGRRELARVFEIRRAPLGTMLAVVGKKMDGLYISLTGTLAINQPGAPERIAPPCSMFGQNSLLSNAASQVDVCTRVNMIVLRLPAAQFTRIAMQYPTMLERLSELSTSEVVKITV